MLSLYGVYPAGEPIGTNGSRIRCRVCVFVCVFVCECVCVSFCFRVRHITSDVVGEHDTMKVECSAVKGMEGQRTLIVPFYFLRYVCSEEDTKCNISTVYMKGCRYALLVTRSNYNVALFYRKNAKRELKRKSIKITMDFGLTRFLPGAHPT